MRRGCRVGAWLCVLIALCAAGCGYLADLEGARYEARDAGGEEPTQDVPTSPMDALLDAGPEEEDVDDLVVLDAPEDVGVEGEDELQDVEVIGDVEGVEDVEDFEVVEGVEDVEVVEDFEVVEDVVDIEDEGDAEICPGYAPRFAALGALCAEQGCGEAGDPFCGGGCGEGCRCGASARCVGGCVGGGDCRSRCEPGSVCAVKSDGSSNASLECDAEATCRHECVGVSNCDTSCASGARCEAECDTVSNGAMICERGASCWMRCAQTSHCELRCKNGASCVLVLDGVAGGLQCDGGAPVVDCGGGVLTCRAECSP